MWLCAMVPMVPVITEPAQASWESRQAPCPCPAMQGGQPLAAAALPTSRSMALPAATNMPGESWWGAMASGCPSGLGFNHPPERLLLPFRWLLEIQGAAGHLGLPGHGWVLLGGRGSKTTQQLPPPLHPARFHRSQLPAAPSWCFTRVAGSQTAPSSMALWRETGAASQAAGCAPGTASMGRMTLTIVWLPLPMPAPFSAKDTWRETTTGWQGAQHGLRCHFGMPHSVSAHV